MATLIRICVAIMIALNIGVGTVSESIDNSTYNTIEEVSYEAPAAVEEVEEIEETEPVIEVAAVEEAEVAEEATEEAEVEVLEIEVIDIETVEEVEEIEVEEEIEAEPEVKAAPEATETYEYVEVVETVTTVETVIIEEAAETEQVAETIEATEEPEAVEEVKSFEEIFAEEVAVRGNYGRLYITDVDWSVAVFYTDDFSQLQKIVDDEDAACMFNWFEGLTLIADHSYQGFSAIKHCSEGSTAKLVTANGTTVYTCKEIIRDGRNNEDDITYNDYTSVTAKYPTSLIMYTCNADDTITITVWG